MYGDGKSHLRSTFEPPTTLISDKDAGSKPHFIHKAIYVLDVTHMFSVANHACTNVTSIARVMLEIMHSTEIILDELSCLT